VCVEFPVLSPVPAYHRLRIPIAATPRLPHLAACRGHVWSPLSLRPTFSPCLPLNVQPRISDAARRACLERWVPVCPSPAPWRTPTRHPAASHVPSVRATALLESFLRGRGDPSPAHRHVADVEAGAARPPRPRRFAEPPLLSACLPRCTGHDLPSTGPSSHAFSRVDRRSGCEARPDRGSISRSATAAPVGRWEEPISGSACAAWMMACTLAFGSRWMPSRRHRHPYDTSPLVFSCRFHVWATATCVHCAARFRALVDG
jgi:hypothetical protein